jgi:hypothetical protein
VSTGEWRAFTGLRSRKLQFGFGEGEVKAFSGGESSVDIADVGTQGEGQAKSDGGSYANGFGFAMSPGIGKASGGAIATTSGNSTASGGNTDPIKVLGFFSNNAYGAGRGIFGPGPAEYAAYLNEKKGKNKDGDALFANGGPFDGNTGGGGFGKTYSVAGGNGTGTSSDNGDNAIEGQSSGNAQALANGYGVGENTAGKAGGNGGGNSYGYGAGSLEADLGTSLFNSVAGGTGEGSAGGFLNEGTPYEGTPFSFGSFGN